MNTVNGLVLRPNKLRYLRLLIIGIIFTMGGAWMIGNHNTKGWFVFLFFGLCAVIFILNSLPNASYLRLTKDGFEVKQLFRSTFYRWSDVRDFRTGAQYNYGVSIRKFVGFDFSEDFNQAIKARAIAKTLAGCECQLSDNFNMDTQKLANLMTQWKMNSL